MKKMLKKMLWPLMFTITLLPLLAFAQDGGVDTIPAVSPALGLAFDPTDLGSVAKVLLNAIMSKQWGVVISLSVTAIVAGLRKWVPEKTTLGQWFRSKLGGIITPFIISLGGAFFALFASGGTISVELVVTALTTALGASGGWSLYKNLSEAIEEKKAQTAGEQAAAAPSNTLDK